MKHEFKQKVFYSDTDAYGVVWHGSYLRWLEMGRVELCEKAGYSLTKLYEANVTLPVVDLNVRYKSPARLEEEILVTTELKETSRLSMTFLQRVYNASDTKVHDNLVNIKENILRKENEIFASNNNISMIKKKLIIKELLNIFLIII